MELYILDSNLRKTTFVEAYESFIWTERFNSLGEFEIIMDVDFIPRDLTVDGTLLGLSSSDRIMVVQSSERITEDDGTFKIRVSGVSLEKLFYERLNTILSGDVYQQVPTVTLAPPFHDSLRGLVNDILVYNETIPADTIPTFQINPLYPPDSIPYPDEPIAARFVRELESLGDTIEAVCKTLNLGFAIVTDKQTNRLYFELYTGNDRTSGQAARDAIIFSKTMDNISKTNELRSTTAYRNVAYVIGTNGYVIVRQNEDDPVPSGIARRNLIVKATDVQYDGAHQADYIEALRMRGRTELAKASNVHAMDGEVNIGDYQYNVDYKLGDIVEQRSITGTSAAFRVVEQVFVSDKEGFRAYPTLQLDLLITLDSWYSWKFNSFWDDTPGYWQDV